MTANKADGDTSVKKGKKKKVKGGQPPAESAAVCGATGLGEAQTDANSSRAETSRMKKAMKSASALIAAQQQTSLEPAAPVTKGTKRKAAPSEEKAGTMRASAAMGAEGRSVQGEDNVVPAAKKQKKLKKQRREGDVVAAAEAPVAAKDAPQIELQPAEQNKKNKKKRQKVHPVDSSSPHDHVANGEAGTVAAIGAGVAAGDAAAKSVPAVHSSAGVERAPHSNGKGHGNGDSRETRPFQRVNAEEWLDKKGAWSNSYEANFGSQGWGAGAQAILGQVRGKDFRHEKTKKKRGTYRGGLIDHSVNSFKFDSDDE